MKGRITFVITVAICSAGAIPPAVAPVPKDKGKPAHYHPTRVGAKWVYKSGNRESVLEVIAAKEEKEGVWCVTVGRKVRGRVEMLSVMSVSSKGLAMVGGAGVGDLTEPLWLLKLPHNEGNKWEAVLAGGPWGRAVGSAKAYGPEEVKVPAGKFQAIRVEIDMPYIDSREGKAKKTIWFAPGVGTVKEVYGEEVRLLKSFDPGKE